MRSLAAILRRLPDWINHMGQLKVLDDDNIFLPLQERRVADVGGWRGKGGYVTPTSADAYVRAYRRAFDAAGPVPHASSAVDFFRQGPLDKTELLDRYTQHTAHCTSCSGALKNANRAPVLEYQRPSLTHSVGHYKWKGLHLMEASQLYSKMMREQLAN